MASAAGFGLYAASNGSAAAASPSHEWPSVNPQVELGDVDLETQTMEPCHVGRHRGESRVLVDLPVCPPRRGSGGWRYRAMSDTRCGTEHRRARRTHRPFRAPQRGHRRRSRHDNVDIGMTRRGPKE